MTYAELTGTQLIKNFSKLMTKVKEGFPVIFNYKGQIFEITVRKAETQGQKLARQLRESSTERDGQEEAIDNQDIYKMYKSVYAKD